MPTIEEEGLKIGWGTAKELDDDVKVSDKNIKTKGKKVKAPKVMQDDENHKTERFNTKDKKKKKLGPFGDMGITENVVAGITRKGFKTPTVVQRKAIPLLLGNKDAVVMAKTGSGKTAAFLIPILHKLHSNPSNLGARALILSPTRELAMQTLRFAEELGKFTGIKAATVLGGESWNAQFAAILSKPDLIIATPGRFVHLCIEMNPNLDMIEYLIFDEADRLFDMGFDTQMKEILARLPTHRQTILFSATLPKILVEFAKAGLVDPELIRLDGDGKISDSLTQTFFNVRHADKVALFLHLILEVIPTDEHTLIFVPTKHHCEYLSHILTHYDIPNSYVYSSLDAEFRQISIDKFRKAEVNHMIVTDVAARGIDIPILDNVVNFNFPATVKLYVHRVGRVARAGRTGTSYSFVAPDEIPHLIDVELFINKKIRFSTSQLHEDEGNTKEMHLLFGRVPSSMINSKNGSIQTITSLSYELQLLTKTMENSIEKFNRCKEIPSVASIKKMKNELWGTELDFHPLLVPKEKLGMELARQKIIDAIKNARPKKTLFDYNKNTRDTMREIRGLYKDKIECHHKQMEVRKELAKQKSDEHEQAILFKRKAEKCSDELLEETFGTTNKKARNEEQKKFFIPYKPADFHAEGSYAVGSKFESESSKFGFDVSKDGGKEKAENVSKWDRKKKKYVQNQKKDMIKTESGQWIKKSYRTDKYFKWKASSEGRQCKKRATDPENSQRPNQFTTVNKKADRFSRLKVHPVLNGKQQKKAKDTVLNEDQVKKKIKLKKQKEDIMKQNRDRNKQKRRHKQTAKPTYKKMKMALKSSK